jgi:hypothetical protein
MVFKLLNYQISQLLNISMVFADQHYIRICVPAH